MYPPSTPDADIPTKRFRLNAATGKFTASPEKQLFLKGPIPLEWLSKASTLPGKTLNVALALQWLDGMADGKPFKLTRMALKTMSVRRDAATDGLVRLEKAGLIQVEQRPGQRPIVSIVHSPLDKW